MGTINRILIFVVFICLPIKAEIILPNKDFKPIDVIKIQLNALKKNDSPKKDAGIEQTWIFAHPINKMYTGPLERFKIMMKSDDYKYLINHVSHEIKLLRNEKNKHMFNVLVLSNKKTIYSFNWSIEKGDENNCLDCWFTSSVSRPINMGNSI